jgi:hypothetical protein
MTAEDRIIPGDTAKNFIDELRLFGGLASEI